MKATKTAQSILVGACLVSSTSVWACSICRCGDPTFNALGMEGVPLNGLRIALDTDHLSKEQGSLAEGEFEKVTEERLTLLASYSVSESVAVFARLPYAKRDLSETDGIDTEKLSGSGLADPELYGQLQLWSSPFEGDVGQRAAVFAIAGVKTDWGENSLREGGERADEHVQPGTGSTDWFGGIAGSYQVDPRSALFASVQYRSTGDNKFNYEYGDVWLANIAYEYKFNDRWDGVLELNYRDANRDRDGSELDENTGGSIFYATPRLLFNVGDGWVVRASAQLPLSQSGLNGEQDEGKVINFGVTYWWQ